MKYDKSPVEKESGIREQIAGFSGKAKMKRLTIDVSANLHSAIKWSAHEKWENGGRHQRDPRKRIRER